MYISLLQKHSEEHKILVLTDQIVHETSHLYLNAVIAHDPLVLSESHERFNSPIRSDLRPMLGIYHAAFVLSRVIRVFKKILEFNFFSNNKLIIKYIEDLTIKYESAYSTARSQAKLTDVGHAILLSTRECALVN
jgi:HEXXH motif-containing protein